MTLPRLHQGQQQIKQERKRFNVVCCGRRFGKNVMLQDLAVETSLAKSKPCAWAAPTYKQLLEDWRVLCDVLQPVMVRRNEQEKQISLMGGGVVDFWSLDASSFDAIRGRKYGRFIINEAGFVPRLLEIWNMVVRPTLIDYQGDAYFSGTPKGMGGLWSLFNTTGPEWARWQMSSYANPHIPKTELDALKSGPSAMAERAFQQEIMAQFIADGAGVFRNVRALSTLLPMEPLEGHRYLMGQDWGRSNDESVSSVWDIGTRKEVCLDRYTDVPFSIQYQRVGALAKRYNNALVIAEANNAQDAHIEALAGLQVRVMPFITTNATKAFNVDQLAADCERGGLAFQADEAGILQMESFESSRTPTGLVRYAAPEGQHDDIPMARLIAHSAMVESGPVILNSE